MKNSLLLLLLVIVIGLSAHGQSYFANYTTDKIVVASEDGRYDVIVNPRAKAVVGFLPSDGIASFTLYKYEGTRKVKVGNLKRRVTKKTVYLRDFSPEAEAEEVKSSKKIEAASDVGSSKPEPLVVSSNEEWWSQATVIPYNETSYRFTVLTQPFKGLSLKSKQASNRAKTLRTGVCEFVIYYDEESDSISTGRAYNWAVFNKIVVEDQDTLRITDFDLKQTTIGKQIFAPIVNKFEADLVITAGPNAGKVIPSKGMQKLDLNVGWNVLSVQYLSKGLPVQAIALFMVSESKKSFRLEKNQATSIDFDNITVVGR